MSDSDVAWQDMVVGDRMAVDKEFGPQVEHSQFTRQEWGLIMTATDFYIEHPKDEERARIVADAENVPAIVPEFENLEQAQAMGASGGMGAPGGKGGGSLLDSVKDALGIGGGGGAAAADEETVEAARKLTQAYADELQSRLEEQDRWDEVRAAAASES